MYSVDPATFDAYKKNDKKNTEEKKRVETERPAMAKWREREGNGREGAQGGKRARG